MYFDPLELSRARQRDLQERAARQRLARQAPGGTPPRRPGLTVSLFGGSLIAAATLVLLAVRGLG